ncbi:MAG: ATP-grasp domain-containing protein [Oscillospiraceae bacterium]|nr:ATP-grasp domain-containing protein [Oscillospiraceae bacterium]
MNKNLAIIGASYLQLPLIEKAKEMGYTTHVFAWACNDVGEAAADHFYPISITNLDEITEKCREIGICGICSIATDLGNITVHYAADKLGLSGNSMQCTDNSTNKHLMRKVFEKNNDPSPASFIADENTDLSEMHMSYPLIVKPTDRSGSRGIFKVNCFEELVQAAGSALNESFEKKFLVEEFVDGEEYSVEGISFNGEHNILAITKKFTTGAPNFIETGHLQPAPLDSETAEKVKRIVVHALDSLGVKNSASHSEIKIDSDGNIKIIEIGTRMGGDCIGSDLVYYSTGIDYLKAVIQVACGIKPELEPVSAPQPVKVCFIFTEDDLNEMKRLQQTDKFIKLAACFPENIGKTTDSSNRAGCYIIKL